MRITMLMTAIFLIGCNVTKSLETEVTMAIDTNFEVVIENKGNSNFSEGTSNGEYRDAYLAGMKSSLNLNKIRTVEAHENPDFTLKITKLTIVENIKLDTVKHEESPDNGKVFELTTASFKSLGVVTQSLTGEKSSWTGDKNKSERKTSFQSIKQIATGENKELREYREKKFDEHTFRNLASTCGSNSGVSVTRSVKRLLK